MHPQGRRNKIQKRRLVRKFLPDKIGEVLKLAALMVPLDARPIVESLKRQMNVLVGFELENRKPAALSDGENVDHCTVRGGECRHLRVDKCRVERRVDGTHVADDE